MTNDDDGTASPALAETLHDDEPSPPDLPSAIGRFAIEGRLGAGGMGVVFLASDPLLDRKVAIKVLHREDRDEARRRFVREAQAMARVSHENIVVVHEVGSDAGRVYIAMELVDGETLARWQAGRSWQDVLAAYVRAGRGLEAAHAAGLVHRDFKPDNVLVDDDGKLRVTDFGLVAATGSVPDAAPSPGTELASELTRTGALLGTPRYMAPEQHAGEPVDARADQFAFCVALYEALYGRPPFAGATFSELAERVLAGAVTPVPDDSDVPAHVGDAIVRGLRRDRDARHPSMRELLAALDPPAPPPVRRRSRWFIPAIVGGIVAIGVAIGVALWMRADAIAARERAAALDRELVGLKTKPPERQPAGAKDIFELAQKAYHEGRFDDAARGFLDAYLQTGLTAFLYNAGAAYQMKGKRTGDPAAFRKAIDAYQRYLDGSPNATDRDQVTRTIAAIGRELAGESR